MLGALQIPAVSPDSAAFVSLGDLWLPILLATAAVFFLSMLAWTVAPHHKGEARRLGNEADVLAALRRLGVAPGMYFFPFCEGKDMKTDEGKQRMKEGPWGRLQVYPKAPGMGASLLGSFVLYLVVSFALGCLGIPTLPRGAEFALIFHTMAIAGVLAYTAAVIPQIIWFGRSWSMFVAHLVDGLIYGLATAAIFAWLWPGA